MTLREFINQLDENAPKKVEFEGLVFHLEGDDNKKYVWMDYRYTEKDGCYELLSRYCLTPTFLDKEIKIIE